MKHKIFTFILLVSFFSTAVFSQDWTWEMLSLDKEDGSGDIPTDTYSLLQKDGKLYVGTSDGIWVSESLKGGGWKPYGLQGEIIRVMNFDIDELAVLSTAGDLSPLYKRDNLGNWNAVPGLGNDGADRVWIDKGLAQVKDGSDNTVYLVPGWTYGISRSDDGGATFSASRPTSEAFLVVNVLQDGAVYANYKKNGNEHYLFKSTDAGVTWDEIHKTNLENPYNNYMRQWNGDTYLYFLGRWMERGKVGVDDIEWVSSANTGDNAFYMTGEDDGTLYALSSSKGVSYSDDNATSWYVTPGNVEGKTYRHMIQTDAFLYTAAADGIRRLQIAEEISKWDGTTKPITKGNGTATDPYLIENAQQWAWARNKGNTLDGKSMYDAGVHLKLMVDLDLTNPGGGNSPAFDDNGQNGFYGFFDGNNKKLSNVKIVRDSNRGGVFHTLANDGVICNLGIISGEIDTQTNGQTGSIVGYCRGDVLNCYNYASVKGSATIGGIAGNPQAGGEASRIYYINNCFNLGTVTATNGGSEVRVGGLIGRGENNITITNSYNAGDVIASGTSPSQVGHITALGPYISMQNIYYDSQTVITGPFSNSTGIGKTTAEMKSQETADLLNGSSKSKAWIIDATKNNGYPYLNDAYRIFLPEVEDAKVAPVEGYDTLFAYKDDIYQFTIIPNDPTMSAENLVVICNGETLTPDRNNMYEIQVTGEDYLIVTATGEFTDRTFDVTESHNEGGTVVMTGTSPVLYDGTVSFTITPETGYKITSILVNEESQTITDGGLITNELVLENIEEHKVIEIEFAKQTFSIMPYIKEGEGTVDIEDGDGENPVPYGDDVTFTITPNAANGYEIKEIEIDGEPITNFDTSGDTYKFESVTASHEIAVTFGLKEYEITIVTPTNGTISLADGSENPVTHGGSVTFDIIPAVGYVIESVKVDGEDQGDEISTYTFTNVTATHEISATFILDPATGIKNADLNSVRIISENGQIRVIFSQDVAYNVQLIDLAGKVLSAVTGNGNEALLYSPLKGIYILKIKQGDLRETIKIVL